MGEDIRHAGTYGAAGILVAILIIAGIITSSLHFPGLRLPDSFSNKGTLVIKLTDAPVDLEDLYCKHKQHRGSEDHRKQQRVDTSIIC